MRSPAAERRTRLKAAAVLAAALLWLSTGRCDGFKSARTARCDTGKEHLDRDLPVGGFYCKQPGSAGRALAQTLQAVDKVHQAEAAAEICMDQTISYQQGLPHSGVFRPVAAESGEYLYCPPQRWLNNLHRAAIVLLYHPCAAADERRLLSALARSCLPHHIVSSHPQLSTPVALVSWGRTLELPTATSAELCHWLEATLLTGQKPGGASAGRKYNLLLTRPAEQQQQQESVRSCCERTRSEHRMKTQQEQQEGQQEQQEQQQSRRRRAASSPEKTGNTTSTSGAPGTRTRTQTLPHPPIDQTPPPRPATTPPGSGASAPTPPGSHTAPALTLELDESDRSDDSSLKEVKQKERQSRSPAPPAAATGVTQPTEGAEEVRVGAVQVPGGAKEVAGGAKEVPGVEEVPGGAADVAGGAKEVPGGAVEVAGGAKEVPGVEEVPGGAADVAGGAKVPPPRTPRSDEAVWAAAALGFLLVLLTLSVLHTRLYRHWRRAPSLYWHHPLDHYDSVADVIRRRLHLAKRRRRRSRRQEVVLLPSSSSSDELP